MPIGTESFPHVMRAVPKVLCAEFGNKLLKMTPNSIFEYHGAMIQFYVSCPSNETVEWNEKDRLFVGAQSSYIENKLQRSAKTHPYPVSGSDPTSIIGSGVQLLYT
jgi:hypothetical protein